MAEEKIEGLTSTPKKDWPQRGVVKSSQTPIQALAPNSLLHKRVLRYLRERLEFSERKMSQFYARWAVNETKLQAYINLPDWEQHLKEINNRGGVPKAVSLVIPYSYATHATIVAYLLQVFTGRRPIFQLGANSDAAMEPARFMEQALQYNADHTRLVRKLFEFFSNAELYGVAALTVDWSDERVMRTVLKSVPSPQGVTSVREREERLVYSGNTVHNRDPYMFFPDPRVPIADVAKSGEFVFWRKYEGRHILKRMEDKGELMWVSATNTRLPQNYNNTSVSQRSLLAGGTANPGGEAETDRVGESLNFVQVDQGSIDLVPAELGLGPVDRVQKWMFTILNKSQIVQAEPMDADHGRHPVMVAEPYSLGHGFGNPSMMDYLNPLQDAISWFFNSHQDNVRRVLNDIMIVDPSAIEMEDLKKPGPGKIIRLKQAASGRDIRTAIGQLPIQDVTRAHMSDAELLMGIGQRISAVADILSGVANGGGRRTAAEVSMTAEGAINRLTAHARLYSAMAIVDLTEMMCLNIQQYMDDEFAMELLGKDAQRVKILPSQLVGDFHYPIHDGSLPLDKRMIVDAWKQMFPIVVNSPVLAQQYSQGKMFEHIAEVLGIRNIESFRISAQLAPDDEAAMQVQAGNLVPVGGPGGGPNGAGALNPEQQALLQTLQG